MTKEIPFDPTFLSLLRNKFNLVASVLILRHILCAVGLPKVVTLSTCDCLGERSLCACPYRYLIQWKIGRNIKILLHLTYSSNVELGFLEGLKAYFHN